MQQIIETCKQIPYSTQQYCYGEVWLSEYDKLFIVVMVAAVVAITVGYIQGKIK